MCLVVSRGGAAAARMAHNHEVRGSSPLPATKSSIYKRPGNMSGSCLLG